MRKLFTLFLITFCASAFAQKSKVPTMHWRDNPAAETPASASDFYSLEKGKILCYLSNDDNGFFVDMIIPDPAVQKKILDIGMSVWIDPAGKDKKGMGVRYPVGATSVKSMLARKGERMTQEEIMMYTQNSALAMAFEMEISGFGEGAPQRIPASGGQGFAASIRYNDDGDLIYKLVIPRDRVVLAESKGKPVPFSVGIEYGVAPVMTRPGGGQGGGAMPQGAPGGRGGQGGARPGMPASSQQAAQPPVWIKALVPAAR